MKRPFDFEAMPTFRTERLRLREVQPATDTGAVFALFSDPEVAQLTDTGPFSDESEAREVIDWIQQIFTERRGMRWAITLASGDGELIGTCGFNNWRRQNNSGLIGYDLMAGYWGQGLMTEALEPMLDFGFERMALNRAEADVTVGNAASARVLEKLGFREEGLLRQGGHWRGEYHDLKLFGLLRSEWSAGKPGAAAS